MKSIFVVTGSNKGIGKAIVGILATNHPESTVILTARSKDLGLTTFNEFTQHGLKNLDFCTLDVTDKASIQGLHDFIEKKYKKFDVLINNAGWASHGPEINEKIARDTI